MILFRNAMNYTNIPDRKILFETIAEAALIYRAQEGAWFCVDVNRAAESMFRRSREDLLGSCPGEFCSERDIVIPSLGERRIYENFLHESGSHPIPFETTLYRTKPGEDDLLIAVCRDISVQKAREQEIRYSQRMDAVGKLAGGIAHDFNNLLTVITGYSDLIINTMTEDNPFQEDIIEIRSAAERAVLLTKQLLAFGRRQVLNNRVVTSSEFLARVGPHLEYLADDSIQVQFDWDDKPGCFVADSAQIEHVFIQLAANAKDAMPDGGTLNVSSRTEKSGDSSGTPRPEIPEGGYVVFEFRDTGAGINEDVLPHIFEPFFTTKEHGKGRGLGLSTAYGIVKQSDGFIYAVSSPGVGTTVQMYFPAVQCEKDPVSEAGSSDNEQPRSGTILLVEDESPVREYVAGILRTAGYEVEEAQDGEVGITRARELGAKLDLVISDVVMPRVTGPELLDALSEIIPDIRVVFITGYAGDDILTGHLPQDYQPLLSKPFGSSELLSVVSRNLRRK
ncbi:MAG: response regulator [Spirochaetales bacterium]|jgi:two-component system, cell cycle sensor histidine kinase and response regulator CckA|nr:response regulator [Spirochaetales bacterium]